MGVISKSLWKSLEQGRAILFLSAGMLFIPKVVIEAANVIVGAESLLTLARVFLGAGWTTAFIGLLGFYPSLADRGSWLVRTGTLSAVVGAITFFVMAAASLGYYTGILSGAISDVLIYFIPGVFIGIVLGFGLFGIANLQTKIYSWSISLLFLVLALIFLFNLASPFIGFATLTKSLVVIFLLTLTMLFIGYLLRSGHTC
jgi:hypothetical protein